MATVKKRAVEKLFAFNVTIDKKTVTMRVRARNEKTAWLEFFRVVIPTGALANIRHITML